MRSLIVPSEVVSLSKRPAANQTAGGVFGILPFLDYRPAPFLFPLRTVPFLLT